MITILSTEYSGPHNTLNFTYSKVDERSSSIITMSIECSYFTNGVWVDTTSDIFDEPELKDVVNNHLTNWTSDIITAYKNQYTIDHQAEMNNVSVSTVSNEVIASILNTL